MPDAHPRYGRLQRAKAGVESLTTTLAVEWAPKVRVNALVVGMVETEQVELFYGDAESAAVAATVPLGRLAKPADIGWAAAFLASDAAAYISGAKMAVHGGGEPPAYLSASSQQVWRQCNGIARRSGRHCHGRRWRYRTRACPGICRRGGLRGGQRHRRGPGRLAGRWGSAAQSVVDEITAAGGEAVTSGANVADWEQAAGLIQTAVDSLAASMFW